MRFAMGILVVLGVAGGGITAAPAAAQTISVSGQSQDSVLRFTARRSPDEAIRSMTSRNGEVLMMHIGNAVVLQLSAQGLDELGRSSEPATDQSGLARVLDGMIRGGLRVMLDRAMEYDLADVRDVRFADGEIVFENRAGERMFDRLEVNGEQVMASFPERDARAFVAHLRAALRR